MKLVHECKVSKKNDDCCWILYEGKLKLKKYQISTLSYQQNIFNPFVKKRFYLYMKKTEFRKDKPLVILLSQIPHTYLEKNHKWK